MRKFKKLNSLIVIGACCVFTYTNASALPNILEEWRDRYPNSNSDLVECQLCHQNPGGSSPWNTYGNALNERITNPFSSEQINRAFRLLERSDEDGDGVSNLDEINDGFQPGWTLGDNNEVFNNNNNLVNTVEPPRLIPLTAIDHPQELVNPIADIQTGNLALDLVEVANGFDRPLKAVTASGINGSIFVVEQAGRVIRVDLTTFQKTVFLDVRSSIFGEASERGLLGLAFHPQFESNGLFYTYQSERPADHPQSDFPLNDRDHVSVVVEYRVSDSSCNSTPSRQRDVLTVDQPFSNHNAGDIAFGPDGMLYIALGDGGGASDEATGNDPIGNGRDNTTILGSILRIDVNGSSLNNDEYGIPSDNPFTDPSDEGLDEIFAYGFRNPYRISFDANNGELYVGDVGQDDVEEINLVTNGGNYGWNWKEGSFFFYDTNSPDERYVSSVAPPGVPTNLIDPVAEYDQGDGVSVIGGFVYRGSQIPALSGRYIFGEFLGRLFYLDVNNNILEFSGPENFSFVLGFGQDVDNELYMLNSNGQLLKLQAPGTSYEPPQGNGEESQCPSESVDELCFPIVAANGNIATVCL